MVVDLRRCIGCQACTVACAMENRVPLGQARTHVSTYELETAAGTRRVHLPRICNHCEDPPCLTVCPTQATYQRGDGAVVVDNTRCVGCGYCTQACPYGARFMNEETLTADKCTFCVHRLDAGLLPACVETCVGGARVFGDLDDPESEVSRLLATEPVQVLKPEEGTEPRVFYIGLDEEVRGVVEGEPRPWAGERLAEVEEVGP
jgi:tetrathionate reductase subunit B